MTETTMRCPIDHDVDLMDPGFLSDPFPYMNRQREDTPVFYVPEVDLYFVTRYTDAERIFLDNETYSAANASSPVWPPCPAAAEVLKTVPTKPTLNNADAPRHPPMRKAVLKALTPRRIASMEPVLREIASGLIEKIAAQDVADLMSGLAVPLPGYAGFSLLGFPESDWAMVKGWCTRRVQLTYGRLPNDEQVEVAATIKKFWDYCDAHVAMLEADPAENFTSDLIAYAADQPEFERLDLVRIVYAIALAGHDSTTAAMGTGLRHLLGHPDQWQRLVADRSLIPNAVEEMLRFDPPILGHRRVTKREVEIGGITIPAGAQLLLAFAAGHRDPDKFEDPNTFDVAREGARAHLSFGKGVHLCIGAPLARLEMKIMLETMADLIPDVRLVDDQDFTIVPNLVFRNLEHLSVTTGHDGRTTEGVR